tara:strand:- start:8429 stop:9808 length:1380 start_codon:yes stop_codon:yes gene_type:complete
MKKKILISLCESHYIRNYISTSALDLINEKYDLYFIADQRISDDQKDIIKKIKNFKGFFFYENDKILKFNKLNIQTSYINEKRSTNFKMLNRGVYNQNKLYWERESLLQTFYAFPKRILKQIYKFLEYFYYKYLGNEKKITKKFIDNVKINSFILKIINEVNPELIIFPANGNKIMNLELTLISQQKNIKTFKICDNWDNPCSRSFIEPKTNYIGVWGKQGFEHARDINFFNPKNIFILGSARFENYMTETNKDKSIFDFKYILLLENFINHKIWDTLKRLDEIVLKNKNFHNTKIIYRPHPGSKDNNFIDVKKFANVILDPQLEKNYNILSKDLLADLSYYPSLLNNAQMIIAAPTTMIIESMMFYKKTIVLGYNGLKFFNFKNFLKLSLHLQHIEKFPILRINKNLKDLEKQMEELNEFEINTQISHQVDKHRNFYLSDKKKYNEELLNAVDLILHQ